MKQESFELYQRSGEARTIRMPGWVYVKRGKLALNSYGTAPIVYTDKGRARDVKPKGYRMVAIEVQLRVAEQA